jgi:hypothetical protein
LFDDCRWQLTEKIFRPIACGQPFILASTPGSLKYLRSYGFRTFNPWIDETYDDIFDSNDRLAAIVAEMKRISNLSPENKNYLVEYCNRIAEYNKSIFFSDKFLNTVLKELKQNIEIAVEQVRKTNHGSLFKQFMQFRKPHMYLDYYNSFSQKIISWLKSTSK